MTTTIQELVNAFAERLAETPDIVVTFSEYSPNGGIAQWTAPIVPPCGFGVEVTSEDGEPNWDDAELSADGLTLKLSRTPERGVHVYEEWTISDAEDYADEILDCFTGHDQIQSIEDLKNFSDWLKTDLGLEEGSDSHNASMRAAIDSLKQQYE